MAASPKQSKPLDKRIANSLYTRFQQLGCPYTDGVEESWITELVFRPGEQRIRLLQWLFCKIDSRLQDVIEPAYPTQETRIDSRIQKLLFVANSLGLCRYDDIDLIKGVVSTAKQTAFMDQLLDVACIIDESEDAQQRAMYSPGVVSHHSNLTDQSSHDCYLIDVLASRENTDFSSKVNILPPDITKTIEKNWLDKGYSPSDWPPVPDLNQVLIMAEDLAKNLSRQNETLQELSRKFEFPAEEPQVREKANKTLRLVLSELAQIVTGFSYCFENHIRQWCNKSAPRLTELGPSFKRVHMHLDHFSKLLSSLNSIRSSYTKLDQKEQSSIQPLSSGNQKIQELATVGEETVHRFQECITILEESFTRKDSSYSPSILQMTQHT